MKRGSEGIQVIFHRVCGLDVHKKVVVACLRTLDPSGQVRTEVRKFGTVTRELLQLLDWLRGEKVTHVAMESTGVFWKPVYNILEGNGMEVWVVNAQHLKKV